MSGTVFVDEAQVVERWAQREDPVRAEQPLRGLEAADPAERRRVSCTEPPVSLPMLTRSVPWRARPRLRTLRSSRPRSARGSDGVADGPAVGARRRDTQGEFVQVGLPQWDAPRPEQLVDDLRVGGGNELPEGVGAVGGREPRRRCCP